MVAESKGFQNRTGWALGGQNKQTNDNEISFG